MAQLIGRWRILDESPLGSGGQAEVFKVRDSHEDYARIKHARNLWASLSRFQIANPPLADGIAAVDNLTTSLKALLDAEGQPAIGALKRLRAPTKKARERLRREAEVYQAIKHKGLLTVLDADPESGWIVTPFQERGSLDGTARAYRGNPIAVLDDLCVVVDAVSALHAEGFVHRDIKTANIFVSNDGSLLLGDAGIAFDSDGERLTSTFENVGTPNWQAPWTIGQRQEDVHPRDDLYSLGKLIWVLISGRSAKTRQGKFHRRPEFDLIRMFPGIPSLESVNLLLDSVLCDEAEHVTCESASRLLEGMRAAAAILRQSAASIGEGLIMQVGAGSEEFLIERPFHELEGRTAKGVTYKWGATIRNLTARVRRFRLTADFLDQSGAMIERQEVSASDAAPPDGVVGLEGQVFVANPLAEGLRIVSLSARPEN